MAGYVCKIVIEDTHPPVWRRVVIPDKITFLELHEIIQILFEWEDEHLHEFQIPSDYITIGSEEAYRGNFYEEEETLIDSFFRNYKWIRYVYDFGDNWKHRINIEKKDEDYSLRTATLLKFKGDNFEEDCGGVWCVGKSSYKVFRTECVKNELEALELTVHEELQEVPLLKESVEQFKELVHNLMQLKPEVLQSKLAQVANDMHNKLSDMKQRIDAWHKFAENRMEASLQLTLSAKSQRELLADIGEKEAADYYKYLRISQAGLLDKQEQVEAISDNLREHPEYLLYIFDEDEYRELLNWMKCTSGSSLSEIKRVNLVSKVLEMGLADFSENEEGGVLSFAKDAECFMEKDEKTRKKVYKELNKFDDRVGKLIQVYGVIERDSLYEIYKRLYAEKLEKEDFFRYIYWHARINSFVNTAYHLDGTCYVASTELDIQNILMETEKYAKKLPYADFSRKEISRMGEDLANRSDWIDILMTIFHYQLGMDMYEAQACLYEIILAIMDGVTLHQVLEVLKEQNEERWSLEVSTELWMVISGLMLEFELPMLKGRSRRKYAKEQNCSSWSVGMVEIPITDILGKDCPMYQFSAEVQGWMYEAVNFGVEDCIRQLMNYKEQKHICSEEYLYLLATACVSFGYTKEAEKLIQQLKSGTISGRRAAKNLKLQLKEQYEVFDDEEDWLGMAGWNPIEQMPDQQPYVRSNPKVGRNDPCPCGSGKKYKKCCGK